MPTKDQLLAAHKGFYQPLPEDLRLEGEVGELLLKVRLSHGHRGYDVSIRPALVKPHSEQHRYPDPRGSYSWAIDDRRFSAKTFAGYVAFAEQNQAHILRLYLAKDGQELFAAFKPAPEAEPAAA